MQRWRSLTIYLIADAIAAALAVPGHSPGELAAHKPNGASRPTPGPLQVKKTKGVLYGEVADIEPNAIRQTPEPFTDIGNR